MPPKRFSTLLFLVVFSVHSFAQGGMSDSLENRLKLSKHEDTVRVNLLNKLAIKNLGTNTTIAIQYANDAQILSKKLNFNKGLATSSQCLGAANYYLGNYNKAVEYFLQALKIEEGDNSKKGIANSLNWLGNVYADQNNYEKANEYYLQALKIHEDIGDKIGISDCLGNLGIIAREQGNSKMALNYFQRALKINEELDDKGSIAITLNSIGNVYKEDTTKIKQKENNAKALEYFLSALRLFEELDDKNGIATILLNIGAIYQNQNQNSNAIDNFNKAVKIYKELGFKDGLMNTYLGLAESYAANNDYKNAYEYHERYSVIKDSIFNEESSKQVHEMSTKYETEKKEQQIKLMNKDKEKLAVIAEADNRRKNSIIWSIVCGLSLVLVFTTYVFQSLRVTRKQKIIIEEKQTAILDSIRYAKKIQRSILPTEKYIAKNLKRLNQ